MKITDVLIANETIGKHLLLVDVAPSYEYKDGKKTESVEGYKYTIAMQDRSFDKITVKIKGAKQMDVDGYVPVEFIGLELFIYWMNGDYVLGARATGIKALSEKKTN